MTSNTGPAILSRLLGSDLARLTPEAAHFLLGLDFPNEDHQRVAKLSEKAAHRTLSVKEREEFDEYMSVADLLAVLQSKARLFLASSGSASG